MRARDPQAAAPRPVASQVARLHEVSLRYGKTQALDAVSANESAVSRLINDPRSRDCFEMAQLQLYQCMSAARFRYENAFCLGQHGLRDIGACIGAVGQPDTAAMTPINSGSSRH